MNRSTLIAISDIVNNLENSSRELHDRIETLNLTNEEAEKIREAMMLILIKIDWIKQSKIQDLDEHIDVSYIQNMFKY